MDFSATSADLYSGRLVDQSWETVCSEYLDPVGKDIADIGCGGGIYTVSFAALGAKSVVGIDSSEPYIEKANSQLGLPKNVSFMVGDSSSTGLPDNAVDLVFERALIHHLSQEEQKLNIEEVVRVLRKGGMLAIQDRTLEDVLDDKPEYWIRATLFKCFPELLEFEQARRPSEIGYSALLESLLGGTVALMKVSELRRTYSSLSELKEEIRSRKGKSILFELTDDQLEYYCQELDHASVGNTLSEVDQWTIWRAKAH